MERERERKRKKEKERERKRKKEKERERDQIILIPSLSLPFPSLLLGRKMSQGGGMMIVGFIFLCLTFCYGRTMELIILFFLRAVLSGAFQVRRRERRGEGGKKGEGRERGGRREKEKVGESVS